MMLSMLIFWNANGDVIGTLEHMVALDEDRNAIGLIDFEAHEVAGGRMRDIVERKKAVGAGTWPEWVTPFDFTVELDPNPGNARARIAALVHKKSGHRRERATIEAAVAERINDAKAKAHKAGDEIRRDLKRRGVAADMIALVEDPEPEPADLRSLLGGPNRPLLLDEDGRTKARTKAKRPDLPVVR